MGRKLQWLEAMRALAAIWVLLHHANLSVSHFVGPLPAARGIISNGYVGVDFFFILSGFIIAFSANRLLETGRDLRTYAYGRLIRIYVPYLPVGIGMFALYMLFPGVSAGDRSPSLLTSLTLLPSDQPPALSVAWTLVHEMIFYALFATIFVSRTLLWSLLLLWSVLIGVQALAGTTVSSALRYVLAPINLCFLLGVVTYYATRKGVPSMAAIAAVAFGVATVALEGAQAEPRRWLLALGFAGLIVAATSEWAQKHGPGRVPMFLGAASYSIYLVHDPVLSAAVRAVGRFAPSLPATAVFLSISGVALVAGVFYYVAYERRALDMARRRLLSGSRDRSDDSIAIPGGSR